MMSTDQAARWSLAWPEREREGSGHFLRRSNEVRGERSNKSELQVDTEQTIHLYLSLWTHNTTRETAIRWFYTKIFFWFTNTSRSDEQQRWECWWSSREDQFKWWHEIGGKWFGCFNLPSLGTNKIANCKKISNVSCDKNKAACNSDVQSTFITERTCLYCFHLSRSAV